VDIDKMTVAEIKHIQSIFSKGDPAQSPYKIGEAYFFRFVTHYVTGRVKRVTPKEIVLTEAAWIADTGRFTQAIADGKLSEVEPFPQDEEVICGRGALVDCVRWKHPLPKEQK